MTGIRSSFVLLAVLAGPQSWTVVAAAADVPPHGKFELAADQGGAAGDNDTAVRKRAEDLAGAASERFTQILSEKDKEPAAAEAQVASESGEGPEGEGDFLAPVWDWLSQASKQYQDVIIVKLRDPTSEPVVIAAPEAADKESAPAAAVEQPAPEGQVTAQSEPEAAPSLEWGSISTVIREWLARANRSYRNEIVKKLKTPNEAPSEEPATSEQPKAVAEEAPAPAERSVAPTAPTAQTPTAQTPTAQTPTAQTKTGVDLPVANPKRTAEAERKAAAEKQRTAEAAAEKQRQTEEAEAKRKAEAEQQRLAEEEAAAEKRRLAEEAEAKRKAEAERQRLAEAEEAKRKAEEEARQEAEAERKRLAEEADAKRKAEAAEQRRLAEAAEAKRKAEQEAEAKRKAEEAEAERERLAEAEAARKAEAERQRVAAEAEAKRKAEAEQREIAAQAETKRGETEAKRKAGATVEQPQRKPAPEKPVEVAKAPTAEAASDDAGAASGAGDETTTPTEPTASEPPPVAERKPQRMADASGTKHEAAKHHSKRHVAKKHRRKRAVAGTHRRKRVHAYRRSHQVKRVRRSRCACQYRRRCRKVRHYRSAAAGGTYVVRRGDTLWGIAKRHYGNGSGYRRIYRANRGRIRSPHRIYVNQRIYLPS